MTQGLKSRKQLTSQPLLGEMHAGPILTQLLTVDRISREKGVLKREVRDLPNQLLNLHCFAVVINFTMCLQQFQEAPIHHSAEIYHSGTGILVRSFTGSLSPNLSKVRLKENKTKTNEGSRRRISKRKVGFNQLRAPGLDQIGVEDSSRRIERIVLKKSSYPREKTKKQDNFVSLGHYSC